MNKKGVEFGPECKIIEVCSPVQAKKVLEANMSLSTMLPCRISVYQEKGETIVATLKPTSLISSFKGSGLVEVASDVEKTLVKIMNDACQ